MFKVNEPYEISVLDKGHVHLVDYMGNDLMVVNAARVSFAKESEYEYVETAEAWKNVLSDKDKKLIKYLAKHKHWTPFALMYTFLVGEPHPPMVQSKVPMGL